MSDPSPPTPEMFDTLFRDAAESEWTRRVVGASLPAEADPFSFITRDGLDDIATALAACRGETIVDLACGRGGPGLWIARRIGAALIGIDFSPVGIDHARARAAQLAPTFDVSYVVGEAAATGLPDEVAAGLFCIDAIQLMPNKEAVMAEAGRLLRPGARAVFTTWEDADYLDDLAALFATAGLATVSIESRPEWLVRERAIFEQALADAPTLPEDKALQGWADEAKVVLPLIDDSTRVLGVAEKPPS